MESTPIQQVLTAGLANELRGNLEGPFGDNEFSELLDFATDQRLTGLMLLAIERSCIAVRADHRARVIEAHDQSMRICANLELMLHDVYSLLTKADIEARLLKGPAVARRFYSDVSLRTFGDIDLLVRSSDWDRAAATLVEIGFSRRYLEPRPGFTARFGKGACFVGPSGFEIDLHRTFVDGAFGFAFDPDRLFDDAQAVTVGSDAIATLPDSLLAVHSAVHAALGNRPPRSAPLRDLLQAVEVGVPPVAIIEAATTIGVAYPLCFAIQVAQERFGRGVESELDDWATSYRPTRAEGSVLDSYTATHHRYARQVLTGVKSISGYRSKFRYVRDLAMPDREYLRERDKTVYGRLKRAISISRSNRSSN